MMRATLDTLRPIIGTLAHNRTFTAREITEYTRYVDGTAVIRLLLRHGYIERTETRGHYYPTSAGRQWIDSLLEAK